MTEAVQQLKPQLAALSQSERAELAQFLLRSLDGEEDSGVEAAWRAEAARRVDRILRGETVGIPAEQVFRELRERHA